MPAKSRYGVYDKLPDDMIYFDSNGLYEVENLCKGMNEEEVLAYFAFTVEEVMQSPSDWAWFNKAFKRGRSKAKHEMVESLFVAARGRQGKEASIAYLQRFGAQWPDSKESDGNDKKNFSFTVVLDD